MFDENTLYVSYEFVRIRRNKEGKKEMSGEERRKGKIKRSSPIFPHPYTIINNC